MRIENEMGRQQPPDRALSRREKKGISAKKKKKLNAKNHNIHSGRITGSRAGKSDANTTTHKEKELRKEIKKKMENPQTQKGKNDGDIKTTLRRGPRALGELMSSKGKGTQKTGKRKSLVGPHKKHSQEDFGGSTGQSIS